MPLSDQSVQEHSHTEDSLTPEAITKELLCYNSMFDIFSFGASNGSNCSRDVQRCLTLDPL